MCDVVERHRKEIESFCLTEGLCAERLFHEAVSFNRTQAFIQLVRDGENHGLLDETPAPVLLHIIEEPDNRIRIETTEHTWNVLGDCSVSRLMSNCVRRCGGSYKIYLNGVSRRNKQTIFPEDGHWHIGKCWR